MFAAVILALGGIGDVTESAQNGPFTQAEIEVAPVSLLTPYELQREAQRLEKPPSLAAPVVGLAVGGGVFVAGFAGAVGVFAAGSPHGGIDPGLGSINHVIFGSFLGAIAGTGLVMALIAGAFLPWAIAQRKSDAARKAEVDARLARLEPPASPSSWVEARSKVHALESERPGLLLPVTLIAGGTVPLIVGVATYSASLKDVSQSAIALSVSCLIIGLALEGIGVQQLLARIRDRAQLDETLQTLEPAPADALPALPESRRFALPPVPVQLAFGGRF